MQTRAEPSSLELCRTDGAAREEPSLLELFRVATEEDEVNAAKESTKSMKSEELEDFEIEVQMNTTKDDIKEKTKDEAKEENPSAEHKEDDLKTTSTLEMLRQSVSEEDDMPASALTLRTILGGDILYAEMLRKQLWLIVIVVFFTILYVAFRYQCQQDMLAIDKLETELKDAKYKALSSSSTLTERCRESHVLEILKNNKDSLLKASDQPPYIINVPEE